MTKQMLHYYRSPALDPSSLSRLQKTLSSHPKLHFLSNSLIETEWCYTVSCSSSLSPRQESVLFWLFEESFDSENKTTKKSRFENESKESNVWIVEVGTRLCYTTPWATNAASVLASCGIGSDVVERIERSRRFRVVLPAGKKGLGKEEKAFEMLLYDRMTEQIYEKPLESFWYDSNIPVVDEEGTTKKKVTVTIPLMSATSMEETKRVLHQVSEELGLAFDDWDVDYYARLFREEIKRDPTDVELFDLAQSNSEHSRHWFFGGQMMIDGSAKPCTLFQLVKSTLTSEAASNSIIAFRDNSSAIRGFPTRVLVPEDFTGPSRFVIRDAVLHGTLTAETHNFPTGVAPFPGAETGTGGRIRDVQCVGRGARVVAGTTAYCVGQLHIPGYDLPWESSSDNNEKFEYPSNLATPLEIEIQASNGASDYGNKFGEPVVGGHTRSFGMRLPDGSRREWVKPIMFTSGVGLLDQRSELKGSPGKGMIITKVGGPAYRIGVGGGAASSRVQESKNAELDFGAVQRGDAEMENKMNRVVRACAEMGDLNPIISIHDQGAGGNGNVLKEICEPAGGEIFLRRLPIGDETMTARELWTAEYQENNALLVREEGKPVIEALCARERVPFAFVGHVTDTGRIVVRDGTNESSPLVVDLDLQRVLGKMPPKTFSSSTMPRKLVPFSFSPSTTTKQTKRAKLQDSMTTNPTIESCLDRVLRLLSVGSKRFLTNKVDRCVTGLVAQQPCVGPLHTPLADVAVVAQSHFGITGVATTTGEQPMKGLVSPAAGARMSVGEALTNLVWARVTRLGDVKCRGNWMWAAKAPGEAREMYEACEALCEALKSVGVAMDGGKDSLSMAAKIGSELVKAPGQIAVSLYGMVTNIHLTVTPDLKPLNDTSLWFIDLSGRDLGSGRLGGSSLAHVFGQIGDESSDVDDFDLLKRAFNVVQSLLDARLVLAGHDRSDGGLITAVLEMAFAGNTSLTLSLESFSSSSSSTKTKDEKKNNDGLNVYRTLFNEELGLVIQVLKSNETRVQAAFKEANVPLMRIGESQTGETPAMVRISVDNVSVLDAPLTKLRDIWEATSFELEKLQCNINCVKQEQDGLKLRKEPRWHLSFDVQETNPLQLTRSPSDKPRVAILREEGSNGDREMAAAFWSSGFDAWDITMSDLRQGRIRLDAFRGIAFVGGFSFADVFGSAKGWSGAARFNEGVWSQFEAFRSRRDTFSLGVCNGCQLVSLLGWIPGIPGTTINDAPLKQPRFVHNESGRFESRFVSVAIGESPAIMLRGMAGSILGVWVAHGEGRAVFPDTNVLDHLERDHLVPFRYVNDDGQPTQVYPFNPNGSTNAIAGLCSPDGRHLCLMPHPERCFRTFQYPWSPPTWNYQLKENQPSPWQRLFQNAMEWCDSSSS